MTDSPVTRILLSWFAENQRPLPWRREYRPYHVWISEIMGQQTRMERVAAYFTNWIRLFPDIPT
ncbi:MAG: A/G-specific adenine glycosylase, partial [Candidatus Electrothrix sp. LOE2]|nr:A/G-specific adenine glycosylase [Candidatus Electrothrix sp. LOE2]